MEEITLSKTFPNTKILNNIFIPTNKEWKSTEENNYSILESGVKGILFHLIIDAINQAKKMICLQSYLIQDTKIVDALVTAVDKRQVRVFILDSAEGRLENYIEEEDHKSVDYVKMIERKFKNRFVHRQAINLHAKFILIDPKTNPIGFLFTGNFNKKPFFENPELAVALNKKQINELFQLFVYHFWEHTKDEQNAGKQFSSLKSAKHFDAPKLNNVHVTSPNTQLSNLKKELLNAVNSANKKIVFSTFGLDINHELSQTILSKLKSGIAVTVFCRTRKKTIENHIDQLLKNGAIIFCHPLIHAKSILIDDKKGYIFSANFESHGLDNGFEVGIELKNEQILDLQKIYNNWEQSFPYELENEELRHISTYFIFNRAGQLDEKKIEEFEHKSNRKKITKTKDFSIFFSELKPPNNFWAKAVHVEKIATLDMVPNPYNILKKIDNNIFLVQYHKTIKKKKKDEIKKINAILIKGKINDWTDTLKILDNKEYEVLEIFVENEKK